MPGCDREHLLTNRELADFVIENHEASFGALSNENS